MALLNSSLQTSDKLWPYAGGVPAPRNPRSKRPTMAGIKNTCLVRTKELAKTRSAVIVNWFPDPCCYSTHTRPPKAINKLNENVCYCRVNCQNKLRRWNRPDRLSHRSTVKVISVPGT